MQESRKSQNAFSLLSCIPLLLRSLILIVTHQIKFSMLVGLSFSLPDAHRIGTLGLVHLRVTASSIHAVELSFSELSVSPRLVEFDPHQFHGGNRHVLSYI